MNNKKIILSFILVVLIALSVGSVSAEDSTDIIAADEVADIVEVDDAAEVLAADPIQPASDSVADVQTAMDSANNTGDTVDLSKYAEYKFGDSTVTIKNSNIIVKGNGTTTISGDGAGSGLFQVTGTNVTIQGIKFVDTNAKNNFTYGGSVNGVGVRFNGANGGVLKDCSFVDFNSAVQVMGTVGLLVENNKFSGGYTTLIANDPTVNVETGSKSLNIYRQSAQVTIRGNTFEGKILDAISIAQGSGSNIVENNVFIGNTYAIYFGGSSTKNTIVRNNTFKKCGEFKQDDQYWERLPVISIQKASNDIAFENNTFEAVENSILIAAEQGNEAHGFPSSLGNINVTGSTVITDGLKDASEVVLFHVLVREGELNLSAPIKLADNTLNGATENITWLLSDGNEYPVIKPTSNTYEAVQKAVDTANPNDIIDLTVFDEYDFSNNTLTITKENITILGNENTLIKGNGDGNGLVYITGANFLVSGIAFKDVNPKNNFTYGGSTNGWGVNIRGVTNGTIIGCEFEDFNSAVVIQASFDILVENNKFTGGYTTLIANDPTVNVETGSKSLNIYRQSARITVKGNTFEGQILDAISIAQGSGSNIVENNVFIGNTYSIYFGGSSTKNTIVKNNTFKNCGQFIADGQYWERLPVISIQKASNDIAFEDNTFYAVENSILIAAEQGNEAHGFPSSLGNINVTGSTVITDGLENASAVVLFHVLVREGELNLSAPIKLADNTLNGATENVTWLLSNGNEYPIVPTAGTAAAVQKAVDTANNGDTVYLDRFEEYDFGSETVTVSKDNVVISGNGLTTIKGDGAGSGLLQVTGKNVTVQGIKFVDTNAKNNFTYGGSVNGVGVRFNGANGGVLKDCSFVDFNSAVQVMGTVGLLVENNNFTGGYTTLIANDPTVNVETGSKSLNIYRQSAQVTIRGNTFEGKILDAISIAQGSGSNIVENNVFIGNTYAIYFGGSSTKNTVVRNNEFINCGEFKQDGQYWERLPVISIQKASNDIAFENNTFTAVENSILIAAEQGNEAHGFPSSLGNINVTNNTVKTDGLKDASAVVLFHVLVREGELNLSAPIKLADNTLNGATENVTWLLSNGNEYPVAVTEATAQGVQKAVDAANDGDVVDVSAFDKFDLGNDTAVVVTKNITLKGNGNTTFTGEPILLKGNGASVTLSGVNNVILYTVEPVATTVTASDVTVTAGDQGKLEITLKDVDGKVIAGKTVSVIANGETSYVTTNDAGVATFAFNYAVADTVYVTLSFVGDDDYKSSIGTAKITVNAKPVPPVVKKATTLTAKKATLKVKKVKKIKVTLKSGGKAVSGKTVTIKVNKKTFKAKTNKKGVATIKVKVTKKGKFTAVVKFAGDKTYKAVTKKVKYTVKK